MRFQPVQMNLQNPDMTPLAARARVARSKERIGVVDAQEMKAYLDQNNAKNFNDPTRASRILLNGHKVVIASLKIFTFVHSEHLCCSNPNCALEGAYFAVERHDGQQKRGTKDANPDPVYHLSLYGVNSHGREVEFTHDHTVARCLGGANHVSNTTTMCGPCNNQKSKGEHQVLLKLKMVQDYLEEMTGELAEPVLADKERMSQLVTQAHDLMANDIHLQNAMGVLNKSIQLIKEKRDAAKVKAGKVARKGQTKIVFSFDPQTDTLANTVADLDLKNSNVRVKRYVRLAKAAMDSDGLNEAGFREKWETQAQTNGWTMPKKDRSRYRGAINALGLSDGAFYAFRQKNREDILATKEAHNSGQKNASVKNNGYHNSYDRLGVAPLDEVMSLIKQRQYEYLNNVSNRKSIMVLDVPVKAVSVRLQTFATQKLCCSDPECTLEASHFAVERHKSSPKDGAYHLNLYGTNEAGHEILFTHDHTLARGLGGDDDLSNTTVMCAPCNTKKSKHENRAVSARREKEKLLEEMQYMDPEEILAMEKKDLREVQRFVDMAQTHQMSKDEYRDHCEHKASGGGFSDTYAKKMARHKKIATDLGLTIPGYKFYRFDHNQYHKARVGAGDEVVEAPQKAAAKMGM